MVGVIFNTIQIQSKCYKNGRCSNPLSCFKYIKVLQLDIIAHNQLAAARDYKL